MTLWRLEWLRLLRTRRWIALAGVYLFFGLTGPLLAAYMDVLLESFGGGVTITVPAPTPADGIAQFAGNASQLGLLVVLIVAAGALGIDNRPEFGAFLRTRVRRLGDLVLPRYTVSVVAACAAFVLGSLAAWYETAVLIGGVPADGMILGTACVCLYLAFAVGVVAVAAGVARSTLTAVALSAGALLALPVIGLIPSVAPWLPSHLVGAQVALAAGGEAGEYARAAVVASLATVGLVALSAKLLAPREL